MKKIYVFLLFLLPGIVLGQTEARVLKLDECVELARKNNPDFKVKEMNINTAESNLKLAKSTRLPQVNLDANYNRVSEAVMAEIGGLAFQIPNVPVPLSIPTIEFQLGSQDNYSLRLGVAQPLFTGFRISNSIRARENQLQAEVHNLRAELNNLVYSVKSAYFNLIKAYKLREIAAASLQVVQAHLTDVKNLHDQGMVARNEVLKIEIKVSEVELMINRADHAIELAHLNLLNLVGLNSSQRIMPDLEGEFPIAETVVQNAAAVAIAERPELSVLSSSVEAAQHVIDANRGSYFPQLSVIGFYEYGKPSINMFKNEWMDYWAVGLSMKWNLWDWGAKSSNVAIARIQKNQILESLSKAKQYIELDVTRADLAKTDAERNLKIAMKKELQAEENLRLVSDQFRQGMVTNTDFLDAEMKLTQAKIDKVQAVMDHHIAVADLTRALGVLTEK
ncbi:MAG: TolC family protein [Candidatus Zhuqueibacterota bacterium]